MTTSGGGQSRSPLTNHANRRPCGASGETKPSTDRPARGRIERICKNAQLGLPPRICTRSRMARTQDEPREHQTRCSGFDSNEADESISRLGVEVRIRGSLSLSVWSHERAAKKRRSVVHPPPPRSLRAVSPARRLALAMASTRFGRPSSHRRMSRCLNGGPFEINGWPGPELSSAMCAVLRPAGVSNRQKQETGSAHRRAPLKSTPPFCCDQNTRRPRRKVRQA